jgi:hypothetical protein
MFTSGQEYAQVIDGFVRQAPSEVTDLAVNSIGKFSEAAAGLVKKLFDKDVPPARRGSGNAFETGGNHNQLSRCRNRRRRRKFL